MNNFDKSINLNSYELKSINFIKSNNLNDTNISNKIDLGLPNILHCKKIINYIFLSRN